MQGTGQTLRGSALTFSLALYENRDMRRTEYRHSDRSAPPSMWIIVPVV